jgi:hypothetical protein
VTCPLVRVRLLALAARILLLLAGLLATAPLLAGLLTGVLILLTRGLILLARIWVLLLTQRRDNLQSPGPVARETRFRRDHCVAEACRCRGAGTPASK